METTKSDSPSFNRSLTLEIYSVGPTIERALKSLGKGIGWGKVEKVELQPSDGRPPSDWYARFCAGGTSMKAAGQYVRGGVVVTWWK